MPPISSTAAPLATVVPPAVVPRAALLLARRTPALIAVAPVINLKSEGQIVGQTAMLWAYYPAIRNILASSEVFNWRNDGQKMSFDDVFIRRMFSSYIYKESNVKDLRIEDYAAGRDILVDADRIKYQIVDFEQALWEY
jgi:hypothetical protein